MSRKRQPYIVNPVNPVNPYEIFTIPSRKVVAQTTRKGKFVKLATLSKGKKRKVKHISYKLGKKLLAKALKKTKKTKTRRVKRTRKNSLVLFGNPIKRSVVMRRRKYRKNPVAFLKQREGKELVHLAIDGAVIVVSSTASKILMDNIASKIKFLTKPTGKIIGHLGLGALIYLGGSRIKKIPNKYVRLATIGAMLPAIIDIVDMVKPKLFGVKEIGYEYDAGAFVPETEAYVPDTGAYVPETSVGSELEPTY